MRFSQRHGYTDVRTAVVREDLTEMMRAGIWDHIDLAWFRGRRDESMYDRPDIWDIARRVWHNFFKRPIDTIPDWSTFVANEIRELVFEADWFEVLDFIEFLAIHLPGAGFREAVNGILEREMSAYRFVGEEMTEITSEEEIAEIEEAIDKTAGGVNTHLRTALAMLSDRNDPDYRNSIKESISAVEGAANDLAGTRNKSLGDVLNIIGIPLHPAFDAALKKLYGYTSDAQGIRHALMDEANLDFSDAKFMLVTCSAFVNYLTAKSAVTATT